MVWHGLRPDKVKAPIRVAAVFVTAAVLCASAADRQILLIGGPPSHGRLQHEHNAGVLLLKKWLDGVPGVHATVSLNGWPSDAASLEKADAIFIFCDGYAQHLVFQGDHADAIRKAAARGAGLMFYHYAVEPAPNHGAEFLDWIGGYFELNHSVNPVWEADFQSLPKHPITRGVKPFHIRDEWYFNIHFRDGMQGLTPILTATPPRKMFEGPDGPRSGNPDVRSKVGQPQVLVWAFNRPNGGRSVGFSGGHYHLNLGDENFRKVVLNSLVWIAKGRVPAKGIEVAVTHDDLTQNLDPKPEK
jgi:hypothetical protein